MHVIAERSFVNEHAIHGFGWFATAVVLMSTVVIVFGGNSALRHVRLLGGAGLGSLTGGRIVGVGGLDFARGMKDAVLACGTGLVGFSFFG